MVWCLVGKKKRPFSLGNENERKRHWIKRWREGEKIFFLSLEKVSCNSYGNKETGFIHPLLLYLLFFLRLILSLNWMFSVTPTFCCSPSLVSCLDLPLSFLYFASVSFVAWTLCRSRLRFPTQSSSSFVFLFLLQWCQQTLTLHSLSWLRDTFSILIHSMFDSLINRWCQDCYSVLSSDTMPTKGLNWSPWRLEFLHLIIWAKLLTFIALSLDTFLVSLVVPSIARWSTCRWCFVM